MGFVVSGFALYAGVLPPNEEMTFKYCKASLVCLPLRCETECKLLKIGIDNVELEDKTSLRLSDMLREPVLVHLGQLSLSCLHRQRSSASAGAVVLTGNWDSSLLLGAEHQASFLRHPVQSSITGNFFSLLCKEKKYSFSLVDGSVAHLGTSQK